MSRVHWAEALRSRAERVLTVAAQDELRRRYPAGTRSPAQYRGGLLWRLAFVPLYRRISWQRRRQVIGALRMTSQGWEEPARRPAEPWRPPAVGPRDG